MHEQRLAKVEEYKKRMFADEYIKKQLERDEQLLKDFLTRNNIEANRTENGVYYKITTNGTGAQNVPGTPVKVYYTGKFLNGKVFDSNMGGKQSAFKFTLGIMEVIMGWDEAVSVLKKGDKATLYIPSVLAYGEEGAGSDIPPNECLIFDVEIVE